MTALAAEGKNLFNQLLGAIRCLEDFFQIFSGLAVFGDVIHGQFGITDNREKDIVKVMRNTPGQRADGRAAS